MTPAVAEQRCCHNFRPGHCPNGNSTGFPDGECPGPLHNTVPEECPHCGVKPWHQLTADHYYGAPGDRSMTWAYHCGTEYTFDERRMPVITEEPSELCVQMQERWA